MRKFGLFMRTFEGEGVAAGGSAALLGAPDAAAVAAAAAAAAAGTPPPFYDGFKDPAVKELMKAKNYGDIDAVGLAYLNMTKLQRGATDVIAVPAAGDADALAKVHRALGAPEKAEEYKFTFGDGVKVEPKLEEFAKGLFHGLGANPAQAQAAADKWNTFTNEMVTAQAEAAKAENENAIAALKSEWAGNDWDANVAAGQRAVKAMGLSNDDLGKLEGAAGMATIMKLMALIGKKMPGERTIVDPANPGGVANINTPEQAREAIARLQGDAAHQAIMFDPRHPERAAKLAHWNNLHAIAYPSTKK